MNLRQLTWDADAIEAMGPVVAAGIWPGVAGLRDTLGGAHLWELAGARWRALVALRGVQCEGGRVLDVVGLRSLGERMPGAQVEAAIARLAREAYSADVLSMVTRRPHLVRACERAGWAAVATVTTKNLRLQ